MSKKQNMVDMPTKTNQSLGTVAGYSTSDSNLLTACFPGSPMYGAENYTDTAAVAIYEAVISGKVENGFQFDKPVWTKFLGNEGEEMKSLDLAGFKYAKPGDPANAYVPNPVSPGEGNGVDPNKVPAPPADFMSGDNAPPPNKTPFVGENTLSPRKTTKDIRAQTLGEVLTMGKSYTDVIA